MTLYLINYTDNKRHEHTLMLRTRVEWTNEILNLYNHGYEVKFKTVQA